MAQTRRELEVIVVNDGSTDDTARVARSIQDSRVRVVSQQNRGLPAARNAGIAAARGVYIALLDSDDLLMPAYLESAEAAILATPDAGFAYTDAYVFDDVTGRIRLRSAMARNEPPTPPPTGARFLLELLKRNFVYVSTTIPRTVLDRVGAFNETLPSSEDYDLWLRIIIAGYQAAWIPGRQALYRKHPGQMSADFTTMYRSLIAVYDGLPLDELHSADARELLAKQRRAVRRRLKLFAPVASRVPLGLVRSAKLAGVGDEWYETSPPEVSAAFPELGRG